MMMAKSFVRFSAAGSILTVCATICLCLLASVAVDGQDLPEIEATTRAQLKVKRNGLTEMLEPTGVFEQSEPLDGQQEQLVAVITQIHEEEEELASQERELLTDFSTETDAGPRLKVLFNMRLRNALALGQLIERLRQATSGRRGGGGEGATTLAAA